MAGLRDKSGFTLVEVLMAVAIAGILMTGVFASFQSQQDSFLVQEQVIELQQSLRAGLDVMVRDIRMAGFDPDRTSSFDVVTATAGRFGFSSDLDEDGTLDANETITFGFSGSDDSEPNGIVDGDNIASLGRDSGGGFLPATENIQRIEFTFRDEDGTVTATPADVRSVEISILARTRQPDKHYMNANTYVTASGATWGPFNDSFRRRFQRMVVQCRNMGL